MYNYPEIPFVIALEIAMKKIVILCTLLIISICSNASDNLKKEKKSLCELIKQEYHSWSITQNEGYSNQDTFEANSIKHPAIYDESSSSSPFKVNVSLKKYTVEPVYEFSDFHFTIANNQAIVQFIVNNQMVSAFLEKENGEWKLVCAAKLDPPI